MHSEDSFTNEPVQELTNVCDSSQQSVARQEVGSKTDKGIINFTL